MEKTLSDLRREMEDREKQHKETIERLQMQVKGDVLSVLSVLVLARSVINLF